MNFSIKGKLHKKFDTQQIKETFRKREFVIEYVDNPMYPQYLPFQLIQDKVDMIEPFQEGQELQVEFNLRGREWTSPQGEVKYFMSMDAWRIQPVAAEVPPQTNPAGVNPTFSAPTPPSDAIDVSNAEDDDLPF